MCRPSRAVPRLLLAVAVLAGALGFSGSPALAFSFTVDSIADAGDANLGDGVCADAEDDCTIRAAVDECGQASTQDCEVTVPAGTYLLTEAITAQSNVLVITGADPDTTILDGQDQVGVFIAQSGKFTLANLTLQHAAVGAVRGVGPVTIENCRLVDNVRAIDFHLGAGPTITDSIIEGPANWFGRASISSSTLRDGSFNMGPIDSPPHTIVDSTLQNVSLQAVDGSIKVSGSTVEDSLVKIVDSSLTLEDSSAVRSRLSVTEGGGIGVVRSSVTGYAGSECAVHATANVVITDSTVSDNTGCGVARMGFIRGNGATVTRSQILRNGGTGFVMNGDALSEAFLTITDSLIADNRAGGVLVSNGNTPSRVVIENTTIARNSTTIGGGGLYVDGTSPNTTTTQLRNVTISGNLAQGYGGGIFATSGALSLSNVTITGNVADADDNGTGDGGGLYVTTAAVTLRNTLIGDNVDEGNELNGCGGNVTSAGYNLFTQGGCTVTGDTTGNLTGVAAGLGTLGDNGGPTPTHALLPTSPAKNAGNPAGCARDDGALLATDQRGVIRPQFGRCDIGAFEATCGNGTVDLGETCDDGNTADGDCCSSACTLDDDGTACSDGNACTTGNACADGVCGAGTPIDCATCETCAPTTGCVADVRVACRQQAANFAGELGFSTKGARSVKWQWTKGAATTLADFGDPTAGGAYALCVFDESGGTPTVAFGAATRTGTCGSKPCWKQTNSKTFQYKDLQSGGDGLQTLQLRAGGAGKAKILLTGKGPALTLPSLPLALPLRAQLHAPNGQCWETRHFEVGVKRNDATTFKARGYQP